MKKLLIAAASVLALSSSAAFAGSFTWSIDNHTDGLSDASMNAAVKQGIANADKALPGLSQPWVINVLASGGSVTSKAEEGLVMVTKQKDAGKDGVTVKCTKFNFGTYSAGDMAAAITKTVTQAATYFHSNECK